MMAAAARGGVILPCAGALRPPGETRIVSASLQQASTALQAEPALRGLTREEVLARRAAGLGNDVRLETTRSYWQILRQNAFTFINVVLYVTSAILVAMGLYGDALVTAGLVLLNVVIAVAQEGRAKHKLDRIALLTRPAVTVIREGAATTVDPLEIVAGDLIRVAPGDQLVVDGQIVRGELELDESLLTGESEPVTKRAGDLVYSGSFCVAGSGVYEAQRVGRESRASQLTIRARTFRQEKTPLQRDIELIIRVMVIVVVLVAGPVMIDLAVRLVEVITHWLGPLNEPLSAALDHAYEGYSAREIVRAAAVVVALVPQGLALMIVVTYAAAALRLAGRGALVQAANAIESLSHVDLLCLDKTGTLTSNQLTLETLEPLTGSPDELRRLLGDVVASQGDRNRTSEALATACPGQARPVAEAVPFSSARKWSAVAFEDTALPGVFVLGAPDVLATALRPGWDLRPRVEAWTKQGRRVLLFARRAERISLHDETGQPRLPPDLEPLALLVLADVLRPEARMVMERFAALGIHLKLISGDDPRAVAALAQQTGFPEAIGIVSGEELERADEREFAELAQRGTVFGRTTPEQKERLIRAFRDQGHYVAMIGDGVNDVLALKQANVGIAMRSGSAATRGVADLILLQDSFAVLPLAFHEGQRIMGGMRDIVSLFLTRSLSVLAVILGAGLAGAPFPITPKHNSLLALLTVGIPTLALAAWSKPARDSGRLLRKVLPFVIPAVLFFAPVALTLYLAWWRATGDATLARTVLTVTAVVAGLLLIPFVQPPTPAWVGGDELSGDWRPTILSGLLLLLLLIGLERSDFRRAFELAALTWSDLLVIALACAGWAFALRWAWRTHLLARLLGRSPGSITSF